MTFLFFVGLIFFIIFGFRFLKLYQTSVENSSVKDPEPEKMEPAQPEKINPEDESTSLLSKKDKEDLEEIRKRYYELLEKQTFAEPE